MISLEKLQEFRNHLLDLAIRGKLVGQRPEEGSAEDLYAQIQEEKQKLIVEGKIKKEKPLHEISKDEVPFEIPDNWKWVKLGDVIQLISGRDLTLKEISSIPQDYPYLTGASQISSNEIIVNRWTSKPSVISELNDILISCKGTVGKIICNNVGKMHIARQIMALRTYSEGPFNNYVKLYLESVVTHLITSANGLIPGISRDDVLLLKFPLPPLAEQKRTVEKLESYLSVISKTEELIKRKANLDEEIRNKILDLAIRGKLVEQRHEEGTAEDLYAQIQEEKQKLIAEGKIKKEKPLPEISKDEIPFEIPPSWKWTYIGELFAHNTGKALKSSDVEGSEHEYITTSNVYWDRFELTELRTMFFKESELERCSVKKGDLLVCEGGDFGRAAIWDKNETVCIQNHLHKLTSYCKDINNRFYLYLFFVYKNNNMLSARGIGIQSLSTALLHKLIVPLPPLAEQKRIVAKIEELLSYCDKLK